MDLNLLAMYDGPLSSPFIVPVAGTVMILGIVLGGIWSGVRTREMQSQERLAAIAKGLTPPPSPEELALGQLPREMNLNRQRQNSQRAGLVLAFTGVGISIFGLFLAWILQERDVLAVTAAGLIPLAIGVGFLVDARLKSRELARTPGGGAGDARVLGSSTLNQV